MKNHSRQTKRPFKLDSGDNPSNSSTIAYELGRVKTADTYSHAGEAGRHGT